MKKQDDYDAVETTIITDLFTTSAPSKSLEQSILKITSSKIQ